MPLLIPIIRMVFLKLMMNIGCVVGMKQKMFRGGSNLFGDLVSRVISSNKKWHIVVVSDGDY